MTISRSKLEELMKQRRNNPAALRDLEEQYVNAPEEANTALLVVCTILLLLIL